MDSLAEKKWFVYLGDHHEGPFSVDDIQGKISEGHVSTENYVWAEGMTDWKVMVELDAFHRLMESSPLPKVSQASFNIEGEVAPLELQLELRNPQVDEKQLKDATADEVKQPEKIETSPSGAKNPLQASLIRIAKVSSGFVILAGFLTAYLQGHLDPLVHSSAVQGSLQSLSYLVRPHLLALSEKFPYLEQWVSPIPAIEDVSAEEYDELKNAAQGKPETHGVRLSIALSSLDSLSPSFYVSTNLPSGAQFVIFVVGVPETLLNQLSFSTHVPVTVTKHLGNTSDSI